MQTSAELIETLYHATDAVFIISAVEERLRSESEKRREYYDIVHENIKAEFINGEIIFHSPVKKRHWTVSMELSARLHNWVKDRDLGIVGVEKVMVSLTRNDYEPDICFFSKERAAAFNEEQMKFPAPDFVVEILSPSTEKNDRTVKFLDYALHGVREYWILDPEKRTVEQYVLRQGEFDLRQKLTEKGVCESVVVTGFSIEIEQLFSD
jgi:Uma2 family endonuclease